MSEYGELLEEVRGLRQDMRAVLGGAMDKAQAAAFLSVSKRTLDELVRNGFIAPVNISGKGDSDRPRVVFRREELEGYLRRRQAKLGAL